MKPAPFKYARPGTVDEALSLLAEYGDEAKIVAGGQSLIPAMNFRLAYPAVLIDITRIPDLDNVDSDGTWVSVGAAVTQRRLERWSGAARLPAVAAALPWVGHLQTRNRGTVAGSLAHADPAAELPAVAVAVGGEIDVRSASGSRSIPASEFFAGPFTTTLGDGEMITSVRFPEASGSIARCDEVVRRHGDFAIAGAVLSTRREGGALTGVRLSAFGLGGVPERLAAAEAALEGSRIPSQSAAEAGRAAAEEVEDPWSDIHATARFRRGAIGALVARMAAALPPAG